MRRGGDKARRRRARGGALLVAACVAVAGSTAAHASSSGVIATALSDVVGSDAQALEEGDLPEALREEIPLFGGREELRLDEDGGIASFTVPDAQADEAYDELSSELQEAGWIEVDSGLAGVGSFKKACGRCTWAYLACVQVGDDVCVLVQTDLASGDP